MPVCDLLFIVSALIVAFCLYVFLGSTEND